MDKLLTPAGQSMAVVSLIICIFGYIWLKNVMAVVPDPYLDEIFHIRQAQAYLQGLWNVWDPKITTPPGLYLVSYLQISILNALGWFVDADSTSKLRYTNLVAVTLFLVWELKKLLKLISDVHDCDDVAIQEDLYGSTPRWSLTELSHTILNICLFPPLFFFYGLYYTDVVSALSVLFTYRLFLQWKTKSVVLAGIVSLTFRQTNIFWVAVYLAGQEVVRILFWGRPSIEFPPISTFHDVVVGSWYFGDVYDPLISEAYIEDYLKFSVSIAIAALVHFWKIFKRSVPYFLILSIFGLFVAVNGGVVLGDKENHIASVHFAQMLYIWPYFIFFSFPLIYPYILNCIISQNHLPTLLRYGSTRHQIPRFWVWILLLVSILGIIHFNTIIHPFTLADNRHYMFYVFRILLRYKWIKYAVAPVYLICGWATIICFGGLPNVQNRPQARLVNKVQFQYNASIKDWIRYTVSIPAEVEIPPPGNRVSLGLIWLLATALSLVTAPLVEPRYFIVPWLIWRLHVQSPRPQPSSRTYWQPSSVIARIRYHLLEQHDHRLWIETAWFLAINLATGYVFLYRGFEWPQEPGQVQRFMW